jgi:hypothetical protein
MAVGWMATGSLVVVPVVVVVIIALVVALVVLFAAMMLAVGMRLAAVRVLVVVSAAKSRLAFRFLSHQGWLVCLRFVIVAVPVVPIVGVLVVAIVVVVIALLLIVVVGVVRVVAVAIVVATVRMARHDCEAGRLRLLQKESENGQPRRPHTAIGGARKRLRVAVSWCGRRIAPSTPFSLPRRSVLATYLNSYYPSKTHGALESLVFPEILARSSEAMVK